MMPQSSVTTFDCLRSAVFQRNPLFVGVVDMRSLPATGTPAPAPSEPALQQALLSAVAARQAQAGVAASPLPGARSALNLLLRR